MRRSELEAKLLNVCRRLVEKGFLNDSSDSFSLRIPGTSDMLSVTGLENWRDLGREAIHTQSFTSHKAVAALHGSIYLERPDVGAIAISSPRGARLLAKSGGSLPPLFDEQVRHLGLSAGSLPDEGSLPLERIQSAFRSGANAALLGERLLSLGMTCERVVFNAELFEKCAQAYVIAKASGIPPGTIPTWVRLIANHRLRKDESRAAASHLKGQLPESATAY